MNRRRRLGIFYTPDEVGKIICNWAIQSKNNRVLEPAFGGCGIVTASIARLRALRNHAPLRNVYGCDVDRRAFTHLARAVNSSQNGHFLKGDFLSLTPADFRNIRFDAVFGNPPYVSYHNMYHKQRVTALKLMPAGDQMLPKTASLWAYFVLHSLSFLKPKGRMLWLLPGSLSHAQYAQRLLHILQQNFGRLVIFALSQRLFLDHGTDEATHVLVCDKYGEGPATHDIEVQPLDAVSQLAEFLKDWDDSSWHGASQFPRPAFALLNQHEAKLYQRIACLPDISKLGTMARVSIGMVTGANKFFVLSEIDRKGHNLPARAVKRILSNMSLAPGLLLTEEDMISSVKTGQKCLLVDTRSCAKDGYVRRYLATFPKNKRVRNATFAKRPIWHQPTDNAVPDAFLTYMNHRGPKMVLNACSVVSTNTVHRVYFRPTMTITQRRLAIVSLLTTFSQLSAEIEGRTYGSGVLKLEPSEAMNILVAMPVSLSKRLIVDTFDQIDRLIRTGHHETAQRLADELLFPREQTRISKLRKMLLHLRTFRYGKLPNGTQNHL